MDRRKFLPPFAALRAFEAVGRLRGVRKAAEALMVDHAIVSRHVRALEAWTGITLLDRSRGAGMLTEQGAAYHARITTAFAEIANATADLMHIPDTRLLRLWCVPGFASRWLMPRLDRFHKRHPGIELEVRPSDRPPDFAADEADVDIRYVRDGSPARQDRIRRIELARPAVYPVISPSFPLGGGRLFGPLDLLRAPLLHEEGDGEWRAWLAAQGVTVPSQLPGVRLWHAHVCIDAARQGQGVALGNDFLVAAELDTGALRRLEPAEAAFRPAILGSYALMAREDRWSADPVAKFRRWLRAAIRNDMPPAPDEAGAHAD